jgi:DNA-directed RNA polymerase specialized sigma24 family protein
LATFYKKPVEYIFRGRAARTPSNAHMTQRSEIILTDSDGQLASPRLQEAFHSLLPVFRASFPTIQDDAIVATLFDSAARSVARHEAKNGSAASLRGLAWTALRRRGISFVRTSAAQADIRSIGTKGLAELSEVTVNELGPKEIEHQVLCNQILNRLADDEREMLILLKAGFSFREIGRHLDVPPNTVATRIARLKQRIKKSLSRRTL